MPRFHGRYSAAITSALEIDSPRESVNSVKRLVSQEISELDRGVEVYSTEYFNHTYVPDLVLRWRRERDRERHVYLRFTESPEYLAEGLAKIDPDVEQPMIFGLTPLAGDQRSIDLLKSSARERSALVTDSSAMESFLDGRKEDPVVGLLTNAITQGGRGLLNSEQSRLVSESVSRGFEGARNLSADSARAATSTLPDVLDKHQSDRLIRFLHAVWIGSGGSTDGFPEVSDLSGELSDEALEFLLRFEEVADLEFWRRVGRKSSVGQISRLDTSVSPENLARLIRANIDILWARSCLVVSDEQPALDDPVGEFYWTTQSGKLALRGRGFTAYLSEQAEDLKGMNTNQSSGVGVSELIDRARDVKLNSLRLTDNADSLSFDSRDVMKDRRLRGLADRFSPRARVDYAQATLSSSTNLNIDFRRRTATGATKSKPQLAEVVNVAIRTLQGMSESEKDALTEMLTVPGSDEPGGDYTLF